MSSFHSVIDFLKSEQSSIYNSFMVSIFFYFVSTCSLVWVYPSDWRANTVMMCIFAITIIGVGWLMVKLELRIGGGVFSHEGADGRIHGFGELEHVADLDNHLASQIPEGTFA